MSKENTTQSESPIDCSPSRRSLLRTTGTATAILAGLLGTGAGTGLTAARSDCPGADHLESPRPGPEVLYDEPVTAPQFEPTDDWEADPLLVCGRTAYDGDEFLSQGWPFDDRGANNERAYPDGDRYANNAADLLELRARPTRDGVAYRIALNTMVEPDAAIVAVGIDTGGEEGRTDWGHGLGDLGASVDHVLAIWGTGATLDGEPLPDDAYAVGLERNQLEVELELDPGREMWRHYAVSGVHDGDGGFSREDGPFDSDEPPVYNVGFRTVADEPLEFRDGESDVEELGTLLVDDDGMWRAAEQADALSDRDISGLGTEIDFGRLDDGDVDRSVPLAGYHNRLYASRYDLGEGIDLEEPRDIYQTRVQPYSVYVPESYEPGEPTSLLVLLHSLNSNYNQYAASPNKLAQLGEERDAIVLMPFGRGPAGWWKNEAELDAFEAWADLRSRYDIDHDRVTVSGYSMGGHGTYRFGSLYPDLFGRGFAVVGPSDESIFGGPTDGVYGDYATSSENPQNMMRVTDNLRHVPLLMWAGVLDELVPYPGVRNYRDRLVEHGYRHRLDSFPADDHFTFFGHDEWGPGRDYLGDATVERRPARVTYRAVPEFGNDAYDISHDGAYWVREIAVADDASDGAVDALSLTDGYAEPVAEEFETESTDPRVNTREGMRWRSSLEHRPAENAIELDAADVAAVTLYVDDAGVGTTDPLAVRVETNRELSVTLRSGAGERTLEFDPGESSETVVLCETGSSA